MNTDFINKRFQRIFWGCGEEGGGRGEWEGEEMGEEGQDEERTRRVHDGLFSARVIPLYEHLLPSFMNIFFPAL